MFEAALGALGVRRSVQKQEDKSLRTTVHQRRRSTRQPGPPLKKFLRSVDHLHKDSGGRVIRICLFQTKPKRFSISMENANWSAQKLHNSKESSGKYIVSNCAGTSAICHHDLSSRGQTLLLGVSDTGHWVFWAGLKKEIFFNFYCQKGTKLLTKFRPQSMLCYHINSIFISA